MTEWTYNRDDITATC